MALAITPRGSHSSATNVANGATFTTDAAFTPTADSLLLAIIATTANSDANSTGVASVAGHGTWTKWGHLNVTTSPDFIRLELWWVKVGSSPSSSVVTATNTTNAKLRRAIAVYEVTGHDQSAAIGDILPQVVFAKSETQVLSGDVTLAAFGSADNATIMGVAGARYQEDTVLDSPLTEDYDLSTGTEIMRLSTGHYLGEDLSPSFSWGANNRRWAAVGIEVAALPAGGTERSGLVTFAELEVPSPPRSGLVSWAEISVPEPDLGLVLPDEDFIPDTSTAGIVGTGTEYPAPNTRNFWWNAAAGRWDGILPVANPPGATSSAWWLYKDIPGTAEATQLVYTLNNALPETYWDEATATLYVMMAMGSGTPRFLRLTYNSGTDTYTEVASLNLSTLLRGAASRAALSLAPNGWLWIAANNAGDLYVSVSTDDGDTWATPAIIDTLGDSGSVQIVHFAGRTGVAAAENGTLLTSELHFFHIDQTDINWATPANWTDETGSIPAYSGDEHSDDEASAAVYEGRVFLATETEAGTNSRTNPDPQLVLYVRELAGNWVQHTVLDFTATGADDIKRPVISIDATGRRVIVAGSDFGRTTSAIFYASLDDLTSWTRLDIFTSANETFNIRAPRHPVTGTSELLLTAGDSVSTDMLTRQLVTIGATVPPADRSGIVPWAELEVPTAPRSGLVSWTEMEAPTAPRSGLVSWAELETPLAPRAGLVAWAELETPTAPRAALVSWGELETPTAPRGALLAWAELEAPEAPRSALVTWAEFEAPTAPRSALITFGEVETPTAPRGALVTWSEVETPNAPRAALVSWAEVEAPTAPRSGAITWAEVETPTAPRSGLVTFTELEVPTAPRAASVTWAELEAPNAPRSALITWAEVSILEAPREALVTWAEMEVPTAPRASLVSWAELETPTAPRGALVSWAEMEAPGAPRGALVSWAELEAPSVEVKALITWAELEVPNGPRGAAITWAELETPPGPRGALVTFSEVEFPTAPRSALVTWAEAEVGTAPRSVVLSWAALEVPNQPGDIRGALVTWAELEVEDLLVFVTPAALSLARLGGDRNALAAHAARVLARRQQRRRKRTRQGG